MKQTVSTLFLGVVALLVLVSPAFAQHDPYLIKVPFEFRVGPQTFPAGEYRVWELRQGVVSLRGVDNVSSAQLVAGSISGDPAQPRLVFHKYGRSYFLKQVWFDGISRGDQLLTSKEELLEASKSPKTQTVLLAGSK